jgi:ParB family chromosome partitioning protein
VKETTPIESLELALIENIHRRDLNPIEEAQAYQRWLENSNTTQETLAQRVGKDRSTIANLLRLLSLPLDVQKDVIDGNLTMGHARVLAGLKTPGEQKSFRDIIIKGELSVRQTENLIKKAATKKPVKKEKGEDEYYIDTLADGLKRALGTKVEIKRQGKKGRSTYSLIRMRSLKGCWSIFHDQFLHLLSDPVIILLIFSLWATSINNAVSRAITM